jgi:UDP-GlcNAc:undecaprenyl-phosphate/decaprenyl-phosphate GlcNAc-1-phosphate transferase
MDGLDGLVSGISLIVVSVTFPLAYYYGDKFLIIISISLIGTLIGFLKFNAYPARIFLGDTGSQALGFFLISVTLLVTLAAHKSVLDLTFTIILLGVPIIDTLKVIATRAFRKKNIFIADMNHIHYLLFGLKIRHKVTVFILQTFSFLYAVAAIYYIRISELGGFIMFAIITIPFLFVHKILETAQKKVHPTFYGALYNKIPEVFITLFLKILLPILSMLLLIVLIGLIPIKSSVNNNIILLSITFLLMLLIHSIINYRKIKHLSDIVVFINLMMIFFYSYYSETINYSFILINFTHSRQLISFIVIPAIVIFLLFRERIILGKVTFLAGIDLIIIVFALVLTVSSSMLPSAQIANLNAILFHSFLLYMFYKVIVAVKTKFQIPLYYSSFIIPIIILTFLLFNH